MSGRDTQPDEPAERREPGGGSGEESTGTVLLAGGANLAIAIAKLVGGLISGSAAMLAEAAHSLGDTLNQVLLLTALKRSSKPADARHPFGYGMERYFWSLLAAVGIFVLGAGYSIYEGVHAILAPEELGSITVSLIVLALAFVFEGASWLKAVRQLRSEADEKGRSLRRHLELTPDPTVKTVAFEDSAALLGIVVAGAGMVLHAYAGLTWADGAASVLIGLVLGFVAFSLGKQNMHSLVGQAAAPSLQRSIRRLVSEAEAVDSVVEVMTLQLAPDTVVVAARVDLADHLSVDALEQAADEIEQSLRAAHPEVRHLFLDPTDDPGEQTTVPAHERQRT